MTWMVKVETAGQLATRTALLAITHLPVQLTANRCIPTAPRKSNTFTLRRGPVHEAQDYHGRGRTLPEPNTKWQCRSELPAHESSENAS